MNSNGPDEGTPVKVRRGLRIESVVAGLALVISIVSCTTSTYTYRLETEPDIILALSGDHPVQIRVLNRGEGVAENVLFGCSYLAPGSPQTTSLWFRNTTPGMPPISKDRGRSALRIHKSKSGDACCFTALSIARRLGQRILRLVQAAAIAAA